MISMDRTFKVIPCLQKYPLPKMRRNSSLWYVAFKKGLTANAIMLYNVTFQLLYLSHIVFFYLIFLNLYLYSFERNIYIEVFQKWGLGIGDWGLGIGPNPQSPIPNPQSPFLENFYINISLKRV